MDVLRENFSSLFPEIQAAIEECSFMSIDTELTGLKVLDVKENYFDTMEERFQFIRETSQKYLIIQFGLVAFFYDEDTDCFTHKAFNFYTYPSQTKNFMPVKMFMCESSSIEFLSSFGFDFNKLFHHGITYLSCSEVTKILEDYEEREAKYENDKPTISVPENLKKFMEETKSTLKRFKASNKKFHVFENLFPFQRRLVFENFKPQHPELLFETVHNDDESDSDASISSGGEEGPIKSGSSQNSKKIAETALPKSMADLSLPTNVKQKHFKKPIKVTKVSEEELINRKQEKKRKFEKELDEMVGFSKIIQEISKSGKVVVGHNMLLDISHAVDQFVDSLPKTLKEFKDMVQTAFPNLIDTKLMACQLPFREHFNSSVLNEVVKRLGTDPFKFEDVKVHPGNLSKGYDLTQGKFHEAGYDAYITGLCFISMCQYLGTLQSPKKTRVLPNSPLVMPYINKLYVMRMMDISYINTSGTDLSPSRDHVFVVSCPKGTTVDNVRSWFSPFGQIQYHWHGDDIYVSLMDKDQSPLVIRNLEPRSGFSIVPFEEYNRTKAQKISRNQNNSGDTDADTTGTTKRPKTENADVKKRKPAVKQVLFDEPFNWD